MKPKSKFKLKDLTDQIFGRLKVIDLAFYYAGFYFWRCVCSCDGKEKFVRTDSLLHKENPTQSCGCLHKEIVSKKQGESGFNGLYTRYKRKAIRDDLIFDLNKEFFAKITKEKCSYCGKEPSQISRNFTRTNNTISHYIYNGIDRVDNDIGYIESNCVPCCKICNRAKDVMSKNEFLEHVRNIYNYSLK